MTNALAHSLPPRSLRTYDIRGIYGQDLRDQDAEAVGRAFAVFLDKQGLSGPVCVGFDGRHSSPALAKAVCKGLITVGRDAIRIECGPTPLCYFAMKHFDCAGSIMVTGSHNPPEYNGLKLTMRTGPVFGDMIQEIGQISAEGVIPAITGSVSEQSIQDAYVDFLARLWPQNSANLTIAWDAGNGAAGRVIEALTARLPGTHHLLYTDINGDFPNHHPDPQKEKNLQDMMALMKEKSCDLGLAFDGDGDRVGVVDDHYNPLPADHFLALLAEDVLARHPSAAVIGDVKCSESIYARIRELGGTPIAWACGHSLIKKKMQETGAVLGGELSGHIFFADNHNFDDALYAAMKTVQLITGHQKPLSTLRKAVKTLASTPELRFAISEDDKFPAIERLKTHLETLDGIEISTIDGVRIKTANGWWLLRASNTEAALSMRVEAGSDDSLEALKAEVRKHLQTVDIIPPAEL